MNKPALALIVVVVSQAACNLPLQPSRSFRTPTTAAAATGMSAHRGELHILAGAEIVVTDGTGQQQRRLRISEEVMARDIFNDIAALGDDNYLLIANEAGYHYDAVTGRLEELFCVLPGDVIDGDGMIVETVQENAALAVAGDVVFAAPTFLEGSVVTEQSLRSYRLIDGTPTGSFDLTGSVQQLQGITTHGNDIIGVTSQNELVGFPAAGGEVVVERMGLDAWSVGVVMVGNEAHVLTADGTIHVFAR